MKAALALLVAFVGASLTAAPATPAFAGNPSGAAISGIRVRPVWWQSPPQAIQLYVDGKGPKPHPIRVLPMCPLEAFEGSAEKGAVLLRRIEPDPSDPTSKERWEPYVTAALPGGSRDYLMILLPTPDGKTCLTRLLSMDESDLRWGATRMVNFTSSRLFGQINGKAFAVPSGDSVVLPFVAARRSVVDIILAAENQKGRELVFSSKGIFTPAKRTMLFIVEKPEKDGYETRTIDEPNPDPKAYEDSQPGR